MFDFPLFEPREFLKLAIPRVVLKLRSFSRALWGVREFASMSLTF
jgi:hypothetical protein